MVRVRVEQRIDASCDAVAEAYRSESFYSSLDGLTVVDKPAMVSIETGGQTCRVQLRYLYGGDLPPGADKFVDRSKLSWIEDTLFDVVTGSGTFTIHPDHYANKLSASGEIELDEADDGTTIRLVSGVLRIDLGFLGRPFKGPVERVIAEGLEKTLIEHIPHIETYARRVLERIAAASAEVAGTSARKAKIALLAEALSGLDPDELAVAAVWLSGQLPQGRIGVGWASLRDLEVTSVEDAPLMIREVDDAFTHMASVFGSGSKAARHDQLSRLFGRASTSEQRFLRALLSGGLRQGANEGVMIEAVARAADVPAGAVRRALMLSGDLGDVARIARRDGVAGLSRVSLQIFRPLQPMLAQTADDTAAALERINGLVAVEYKLDGARVQVHRNGSEVRVYSRTGKDVTDRVPELVDAALTYRAERFVLDGEALTIRSDGRPQPFQITNGRFGAKTDVATLRYELPLRSWFFDVLHIDGEDLLDADGVRRQQALADVVAPEHVITRLVGRDGVQNFFESALAEGHEGVVVKALDSSYAAGRRGAGWIKVKPSHTLDLVVLAIERGSGRRSKWLSNIHLGARSPDGGFVMLGKTFKGMTDEMLEWQTNRFTELAIMTDGHVTHVRPEQVVEIAFDGLQASTRYPGGMALRFARVKRYRDDKPAAEADTIEMVRAIFDRSNQP